MKQAILGIVLLMIKLTCGIMSIMLLSVQPANAAFLAYTKEGYPACVSLVDFEDMETCFLQRDSVAVNKIVEQGRCILLKPDVKVYAWAPEWAQEKGWAQIRLPGSTVILWTFRQALERAETRDQKLEAPPARKYEHFLLKSFLWMKSGMTKKQEIVRKYGKPDWEDVAGGEVVYYGTSHHPDFKEWISISFIFDGDVLEEIRAMKEK